MPTTSPIGRRPSRRRADRDGGQHCDGAVATLLSSRDLLGRALKRRRPHRPTDQPQGTEPAEERVRTGGRTPPLILAAEEVMLRDIRLGGEGWQSNAWIMERRLSRHWGKQLDGRLVRAYRDEHLPGHGDSVRSVEAADGRLDLPPHRVA